MEIDALKTHPRVLDLYASRIALTKRGKEFDARCPFHSEKTPSFQLNQNSGKWLFHCKGCGAGGDIISFIQKTDNCSFPEAVKIVREFTSEFAGDRARVESVFRPISNSKPVIKTYPEESYRAYEEALKNSKEAQAFLKSRGITVETAQRLRIGFRQDVGKFAGESGASVAPSGWIVFPTFNRGLDAVHDKNPVVSSLKYRSIAGKYFCKQPGMSTCLFNTQTIDFLEPVYLVEGELDCAVLEQAGFRAISLPNAQYQCTPADKDLLLSAEYVVLAGDNDDAGKKAMDKLFREMKERTFWLRWPEGVKDANQFFLDKCSGDVSRFHTEIQKLVETAKSKPMEGVYDVRQSLLSANHTSSIDNPNRLRFPWPSVDDMAVILPGDVVTIYSTDSGMGKTTLILQASLFAGMKNDETILNYQAEMSPQQIDTIIASHILKKDRLSLSEDDYKLAGKALPANLKYYIGRDTSLTNIGQVLDLIEAAIRRFGATCVILDNLHFLCRNETDPIKAQSNASQRIKNLAGQYNVKWINVHQARKADQNHKRKVTHVSDLDGSKAVQNDSSVIFSIHREEIKHLRDEESGSNEYDPIVEIRLQKVREKGPGKSFTTLMFIGGISTFSEISPIEEPKLFGN